MTLTEEQATDWTAHMVNTDGSTGPHWSMEQTEIVKNQRGINWNALEFWVAMNMVYSDYSEVFKTYGVRDKIYLYADIAYAFLADADAEPGKLAKYYNSIISH